MPSTLRVILFTANSECAPELRRSITSVENVRIVAELDEPSLIAQAVAQFPAELVIADLDPSALVVVELADMVGPSQKVALVDLDFRFGHVATLLDVHGQYTVSDLCASPEQLDPEMVLKALIKHESGLFVLRRPHTFAQAESITAAHC